MSKSLVEFKRFLAKSAPTLSEYENKLANLMLGSFDEIAAVGAAGGRRGKVLAKLIVDGFYPDYTDGCKTAENSKSLFATRRLIRGL